MTSLAKPCHHQDQAQERKPGLWNLTQACLSWELKALPRVFEPPFSLLLDIYLVSTSQGCCEDERLTLNSPWYTPTSHLSFPHSCLLQSVLHEIK